MNNHSVNNKSEGLLFKGVILMRLKGFLTGGELRKEQCLYFNTRWVHIHFDFYEINNLLIQCVLQNLQI